MWVVTNAFYPKSLLIETDFCSRKTHTRIDRDEQMCGHQWRIQGGFLVARKPPPAMIFF